MNSKTTHDVNAAISFLKNLHEEILIGTNIEELQNPQILKKFEETIEFLQKILST